MAQYSNSLDPGRKQIRRLVLQPLSAGHEISCSTETVSLLDGSEYEALSYVWGNPSSRRSILFDGLPISVTGNLAVALHHLRLPYHPRMLWVDALCINQNDTKERNQQVGMMGEIYANAKPVLIWLGESSEGDVEAFALISTVTSGDELSEATSQELFSFYLRLVDREWFSRIWTVQELVLATQDPLVGCGLMWTTWSILSSVWKKVALTEFGKMEMVVANEEVKSQNGERDDFNSGVRPSGIRIDLLNNLRISITTKGGEALRDLILNTTSSNVTEPRDRIYALLGMMSEEHGLALTVDYDLSLGMVYAEAVKHIFKTGNGPWLLSGMELAGIRQDPSFPSWVPMFGSKSLLTPIRFHGPGVGASGAGTNCVNGTIDQDLKILHVRGMPIDTVVDIVSFGDGEECLNQLSQVDALSRQARELAILNTISRPYLNDFKTKEPAWRTLIANKAYSGAKREVAPNSYGEMYEMLLHRHDSADFEEGYDDDFVRDYKLSLLNSLPSRCFFITKTGFCGIGPGVVEIGDRLVVWFGSPAPFVLRQISSTNDDQQEPIFSVLSAAYVAGIMDGEMVDEVYCEDFEDDVVYVVQ